jgi:GT2 family glycosyltransferase
VGINGKAETTRFFNYYRLTRAIRDRERISIIIPVRNHHELLRNCIKSIQERAQYDNYEIIVVDNGSDNPRTMDYLRTLQHRVIRHDAPYNFSELNTIGAKESTGEHLLFLNNDTQALSPGWLPAMLEHSQRPEVGAVGAKLIYPDGRIQHAGIVLGLFGLCEHIHKFDDGRAGGYMGLLASVRNCSAVTAACCMIPKKVFAEVGGFDERLHANYNDVDLCLRIRERGYLVVYTPYSELLHLEHATRREAGDVRAEAFPEDTRIFLERWENTIRSGDPYYNPNLDLFSWIPRPNMRPLRILGLVYKTRPDLQKAYPEVAHGDYLRLVQWASRVGIEEHTTLREYAEWYLRMSGAPEPMKD